MFQLFDWYSATFSLMFIAFLESLVIAWIYGNHLTFNLVSVLQTKNMLS